jgi:energy-coupling factor transporter transmembrane protein EcfT
MCAYSQRHRSIRTRGPTLGVTVNDLLYIGLTIVIFAVLILLVKGVERFER